MGQVRMPDPARRRKPAAYALPKK